MLRAAAPLDAPAAIAKTEARVPPDDPDDIDELEEADGSAPAAVGLIDIHAHLLPGVDDGCRDVRESLECARALSAAGYTHVFCTPHVSPQHAGNNASALPPAVAQLQAALDEADIALKLLPGGELRLGPKTLETPRDDLVLMNLGNSRGGRFILFDVWESEWPTFFDKAMLRFMQQGITPIMAHPERCPFVCEEPLDAAERLAELGVLLQLNSYVLGSDRAMARGMFSKAMRHAAERLLEFDYYSFLGTDLHRADMLDECLGSIETARQQIGSGAVRRLAKRNPLQLLPAE